MKIKSALNVIAVLLCIAIVFAHPMLAPFLALAVAACWLAPEARLGVPTLILPILTGKVIEAFKQKVPLSNYFSTDFGEADGSFAMPVKFGQPVISQIASIPAVGRFQPNAPFATGASPGLGSNSQSATSLVTDVTVGIDRAAKATIRLPAGDIMQLLAMPAFLASIAEAGAAIGRFMINDAIREGLSARNFSYGFAAPTPDLDTPEAARVALNNQFALQPRYGLCSTNFMSALADDPRVQTLQGYNQRIGGDAYASFTNLKGFEVIQEMNQFPTGNDTLGTFTADSTTNNGTFTVVALAAKPTPDTTTANVDPVYDIYNGARVQISEVGGAVPTGLAAATNYYIINYNANAGGNGGVGGTGVGATFQLAATLGGASIHISDDGSGTLTVTQNENLEGLFYEKRAIHIASRPMIDPTEAGVKLGIPQSMLAMREIDPATKISFMAFMWQDNQGTNPTQDIFITFVAQYGIRAGKALALPATGAPDVTTLAPGSGMDRCMSRVITA